MVEISGLAETTDQPPPDSDHSELDELLERCLDRLIAAGPSADPAELEAMMDGCAPSAKPFVFLELIKLDMALHAENGSVPPVERYLSAAPDLVALESIPVDLVMEEIQLRKEGGESPSRQEYADRFPRFDSLLVQLFRDVEATAPVAQLHKPPQLEIGMEVDDFVIVRKLGEGSFAHVFLAKQISMSRLVALKVSSGRGDEPQALAQFDHPNIVRVYDQRTLEQPAAHLLYMQFHPGGTLAEVVKAVRANEVALRRGHLLTGTVDRSLLTAEQVVPDRSTVREWVASSQWPIVVAWIGVQLADALQTAHRKGVLHRDVKPANVLLSAEAIPKLADFNVSFAGAAGRAGAASSFGGSVGYMAPEHLKAINARGLEGHAEVGPAADVYSLGILLWELWQGQRPFESHASPRSWSEMVHQQLESRDQPLIEPDRQGSACERVLERTLRAALQKEIEGRPRDAAELAGRLRLALHPEAAALLDPGEETLASRLTHYSPWLVAGLVILLPNIAAGLLNYEYNSTQIDMSAAMKESLRNLAMWVNSILYPLGVVLMVIFTRSLVRSTRRARESSTVTSNDLDDTLNLGNRAALIGGTCWIGAGIVYTTILSAMYDDFTLIHATHFFISMVICGGVAMIYPLFGTSLLATYVYYPLLVSGTMRDPGFDARHERLIRRCEGYLLIALLIPLLGAALLISSESGSKEFTLTAIASGIFGVVFSFYAYRWIAKAWQSFAEVLSTRAGVVPGEIRG